MKQNWTINIDKYSLFFWALSFKVNEKTYKEKILNFDVNFLCLANKYKLLTLKFEKEVDFENFLQQYYASRSEIFFNNQSEKQYLYLLDLYQFLNYPKFTAKTTVYETFEGKIKPVEYITEVNYNGKDAFLSFDGQGSFLDLKELKKDYQENWEEEVTLSIISNSNIWLDVIDLSEVSRSKENDLIDNRVLAYRLTPRLNSFLRDLKNYVISIGGEVDLVEHFGKYVTEEGVLLDGKIIYQEDIDEGRVQLPD